MRTRVLAAALAAVLGSTILPAGAVSLRPTPGQPAPGPDLTVLESLPADALVVSADDDGTLTAPARRRIDDLFADPTRLRAAPAMPAIQRELVAEAWGVDLPPVWSDEAAEEDLDDDGWWELPGELAWAGAGGDLTGDGLTDVLVETWEPSTGTIGLRAIRGLDGSELWRLDEAVGDDAFAWPAGDLTGDGIDDLLALSLEYGWDWDGPDELDECDGSCALAYELSFILRLHAINGQNGQSLWSRTWEGLERYEESWSSGGDGLTSSDHEGTWTYEMRNAPEISPSRDHEGPGSAEVILNTLDLRVGGSWSNEQLLLGVTGSENWESWLLADTVAELTRAATGEVLFTATAEEAPIIALLGPAGDLNGDGAADLLWHRTHQSDEEGTCAWVLVLEDCETSAMEVAFELVAVDGRALTPLWERRWDDLWGWWVDEAGDLDGSGSDDLMVTLATAPDDARHEALDGAGGTSLWSAEAANAWSWPVPIGAVEGGSGTDVVVLSVLSEETLLEGRRYTLDLTRLRGRDGQTFANTRRAVDPGAFWLYLFVADDLDGDGVRDVGGGWLTMDRDPRDVDSSAFVESGADAAVHLELAEEGETLVTPFGDLDGDGAGELAVLRWTPPGDEAEGWRSHATVHRLVPGGGVLWQASSEDVGHVSPGGDQDGVPGDELLAVTNVAGAEAFHWTVVSRSGLTLEEHWRLEG